MRSKVTAALLALWTVTGCSAGANLPAIIPQPAGLEVRSGLFELTGKARICFEGGSAAEAEAQNLAASLRPATGFKFRVSPVAARFAEGGISLKLDTTLAAKLGQEGYELSVTPKHVSIRAGAEAGLFYGGVTLRQLLPPDIFSTQRTNRAAWQMPCVEIVDTPRFPWRGLLLDVSRHFFNKEEVKRVIEGMALHKLNVFHWHLVDDTGWRLEIKKYPRLTEVGAWRKSVLNGADTKSTTAYGPDGRYGGFYTQAEIREVVAFAQKLHITIVPEIEMPAHSMAALVSYPNLSCLETGYESIEHQSASVGLNLGVSVGVYCAGKDETYEFLQNVIKEVMEIFPGKYIHIGGDEVGRAIWKKCARCQARIKHEGLKNEEELQGYFTRRIEKFVNANGRSVIDWSHLSQKGQTSVFTDWIGGGSEAANAGREVVMTPAIHCYFDYYQSLAQSDEPRAIGGYLPLDRVYAFEPVPANLASEKQALILGTQGNIWTEYIASLQHVHYMAYPRLSALSEVAWSPRAARNFDDFRQRLATHNRRLEKLGINYRREPVKRDSVKIGEWTPSQITTNIVALEWDVTRRLTAPGKYRAQFSYRQGAHGLKFTSLALLEDGRELARDTHDGFAGLYPIGTIYTVHLSQYKANARYTLRVQVDQSGGTDSQGTVSWESAPAAETP